MKERRKENSKVLVVRSDKPCSDDEGRVEADRAEGKGEEEEEEDEDDEGEEEAKEAAAEAIGWVATWEWREESKRRIFARAEEKTQSKQKRMECWKTQRDRMRWEAADNEDQAQE